MNINLMISNQKQKFKMLKQEINNLKKIKKKYTNGLKTKN